MGKFRRNGPGISGLATIIAVIFIGVLFLSSCGGETGPEPDLVMWTGMGGEELEVLKDLTREFNEETGLYVSIINVPFNELKIKYQIAAPAGQGPDLITGPQDWIGFLATADLIDSLGPTEFTAKQQAMFNPVALENMRYNGQIYGMPFFLETLAIIYNPDLVEYEPQSMEELLQVASEFNDPDEGKYGFFFEITNFYFSWPFIAGYGGEIFGTTGGKLDVTEIKLNSPQTVEAMRFLASFKDRYELIPEGATTDMMNGIFFNRNMMFCLNGPWMLGELKKQNLSYDVMPLPPLPNGKMPRPFVGVQGILLNKNTRNRSLAVKFMHYLNKPENQKRLCLAAGRIPSRRDTLELIQNEDAILKYAKAAEYGTPLPNHPAMNAVWEPMNEALTHIVNEGKDPEEVLSRQVKRIKEDIKLMME